MIVTLSLSHCVPGKSGLPLSSTSVSVVMQMSVPICDALSVKVLQPLWKHSQPCSQKEILSMLEVLGTIAASKGPPVTEW
jgi:hypothetical protein